MELPDDVVAEILAKTEFANDLVSASRVCKSWHTISKDPNIWKKVYLVDFEETRSSPKAKRESWEEMYRSKRTLLSSLPRRTFQDRWSVQDIPYRTFDFGTTPCGEYITYLDSSRNLYKIQLSEGEKQLVTEMPRPPEGELFSVIRMNTSYGVAFYPSRKFWFWDEDALSWRTLHLPFMSFQTEILTERSLIAVFDHRRVCAISLDTGVVKWERELPLSCVPSCLVRARSGSFVCVHPAGVSSSIYSVLSWDDGTTVASWDTALFDFPEQDKGVIRFMTVWKDKLWVLAKTNTFYQFDIKALACSVVGARAAPVKPAAGFVVLPAGLDRATVRDLRDGILLAYARSIKDNRLQYFLLHFWRDQLVLDCMLGNRGDGDLGLVAPDYVSDSFCLFFKQAEQLQCVAIQ